MGKTMRVAAAALFLTLTFSAEGRAQQWFWGMEYMVSSSSGDTKDFANQFSWRNFGIEGRYQLKDNISAGLYFAWNVFAEQTDTVITAFDGTLLFWPTSRHPTLRRNGTRYDLL